MTADSPRNIPVIDKEREAGELLDVLDGLAVDPVEDGLVLEVGLGDVAVEVGFVVEEGVELEEVAEAPPAA